MAEIIVTRAQERGRVDLRSGDTLVVRLAETPSSGFRWAVEGSLPAPLISTSDTFLPSPDSAVGGGGIRELSFRASAAGSCELRLVLWRQWEGESSITNRFSVRVSIV